MRTRPNPELDALLKASVASVAAMSPAERAKMHRRQRASFVRSEAGMGSDQDEAEYADALRSGDQAAISECERKAQERITIAERVIEDDGA